MTITDDHAHGTTGSGEPNVLTRVAEKTETPKTKKTKEKRGTPTIHILDYASRKTTVWGNLVFRHGWLRKQKKKETEGNTEKKTETTKEQKKTEQETKQYRKQVTGKT